MGACGDDAPIVISLLGLLVLLLLFQLLLLVPSGSAQASPSELK